MNHEHFISIDEDNLDHVAGGTGCLPSPCAVVEGVLQVAGEVAECGIKTLESLLCAKVEVSL